MGRVGQLIEREFGVRYHVKYINRLLTTLGWSLQQPLPRAAERDEGLTHAPAPHAQVSAPGWRRMSPG